MSGSVRRRQETGGEENYVGTWCWGGLGKGSRLLRVGAWSLGLGREDCWAGIGGRGWRGGRMGWGHWCCRESTKKWGVQG